MEWKEKLNKIIDDNMIGFCSQIGGAEHLQIKELIEQEIEKAREEGKREGIEIYSRYMELIEKEKHTYFEDKDVDELNELELLISKLKDNK